MGMSLADALRQVDLQGGHVYQCQVGRFRVEVRVAEAVSEVLPAPLRASDVMLDAWIDLPTPKSAVVCRAAPGPPLIPDIPDLPPGTG
jgi:hypothetical protein